MRILPFFLLLLLFACNEEKRNNLLTPDALPKQVYRINTARDTVLKTANGALIKIDRESFSGADGEVELEVKEAYSIEDMISAGLTTQTYGRPLRSGGMIYLDAIGDDVSIRKPIQISLPSDSYDGQMMLYKGELEDGKINWVEPELLKDSVSPYLIKGKALFDANCVTCHLLDKALTGPALRGTETRGPWQDRSLLFAFTRNAGGFIPKTCYTKNLVAQYNGQIMPSFPQLDDGSLHAIYDYIKDDDIKKGVEFTNNFVKDPCDDSCYRFDSIRFAAEEQIGVLNQHRNKLIEGNENRINYERWDSAGTQLMGGNETGMALPEKVQPEEFKAIYYRFDIDSFGWYNVDALLEIAAANAASLSVQVDDALSDKWDLFIAVPDRKVFDRGGKLANEKDYGFFTRDGKMPLNPGTSIVVFALGEANGQIAFDYKELKITGNDVIRLEPRLASKEEFNKKVKSWSLNKVTIQAADSKNATEIRKADKEIRSQQQLIENYRPKNCNCSCGEVSPSGDSTQLY